MTYTRIAAAALADLPLDVVFADGGGGPRRVTANGWPGPPRPPGARRLCRCLHRRGGLAPEAIRLGFVVVVAPFLFVYASELLLIGARAGIALATVAACTAVFAAATAPERGWHIVVYLEAADLGKLDSLPRSLPGTVVIDHMGRPDVGAGVDGEVFGRFLALIEDGKFWTKVSGAERLSVTGPPYSDVVPFAWRIVEAAPGRVPWGTDWPHPNMKSHRPDDGLLVDRIPVIAPTAELRRKLLVGNPARPYWSE